MDKYWNYNDCCIFASINCSIFVGQSLAAQPKLIKRIAELTNCMLTLNDQPQAADHTLQPSLFQ